MEKLGKGCVRFGVRRRAWFFRQLLGKDVARDFQYMRDGHPCGLYDGAELSEGSDVRVALVWVVVAPRPTHLAELEPKSVSEPSQSAYEVVRS